jgi:hypothetical protein
VNRVSCFFFPTPSLTSAESTGAENPPKALLGMNKLPIFLVAFMITGMVACGDEQIRRIQEELRKRNLYFGEIDGKGSEETIRALQRYQSRKGFKPTGELDAETLSSLNIASAPPDSASWPEVPVLKSDTAKELKEEDRKFLDSLEPIAEPPPEEVIVLPPKPDAPIAEPTPSRPKKETVVRPKEDRPEVKDSQPPAPGISEASAEDFVRDYLEVCETNRLASEMAFYADKVKYFDHGTVTRSFIERDVAAFYKRWPSRSYELLDFKVLHQDGDQATVKFRIAFNYRGARHKVAGKTDNVFAIQRKGEQMKFTAMREQRLRE